MSTAETMHAEITANVDEWYAGRISFETFGERQIAIYDRAAELGIGRDLIFRVAKDSRHNARQ